MPKADTIIPIGGVFSKAACVDLCKYAASISFMKGG